MANRQDVRNSLAEFVRQNTGSVLVVAEVISVDKANAVCDVSPIDNKELVWYDVRLQVLPDSGLLLLPKVGSFVIVGTLGLSQGLCALQFSGIDKVYLSAENGIEFNGGAKGEMVDIAKLKARLNDLENDITVLKNAFKGWTVVLNDGGTALKSIAATWYNSTLSLTETTDLANDQITQ